MAPYYEQDGITIYHGDSLDVVPMLEPESISAVITDPPYGLTQANRSKPAPTNDSPYSRHRVGANGDVRPVGGFMGKEWDGTGIEKNPELWRIIRDAMKPGAHLAAFGGSRTYHRMGVAIEDAGLELRDTLMWLYGSGFPKSHDVSKAIDKAAGAEREVVGRYRAPDGKNRPNSERSTGKVYGEHGGFYEHDVTAPATPEAAQWAGWGTALKPAHEPIILARKPLAGTVAANVLAHGTGALNIDACRINPGEMVPGGGPSYGKCEGVHDGWRRPGHASYENKPEHNKGRWPANVILDEDAALQMGEPARYFYCAKSSRRERNAGLDGMPERRKQQMMRSANGTGEKNFVGGFPDTIEQNHHPTVKPLALMRYLVTLIAPPGGIVLDPFAGSGTTGVVCAELGIPCVLIEKSEDYLPIIVARIRYAQEQRAQLANQYPLGV